MAEYIYMLDLHLISCAPIAATVSIYIHTLLTKDTICCELFAQKITLYAQATWSGCAVRPRGRACLKSFAGFPRGCVWACLARGLIPVVRRCWTVPQLHLIPPLGNDHATRIVQDHLCSHGNGCHHRLPQLCMRNIIYWGQGRRSKKKHKRRRLYTCGERVYGWRCEIGKKNGYLFTSFLKSS